MSAAPPPGSSSPSRCAGALVLGASRYRLLPARSCRRHRHRRDRRRLRLRRRRVLRPAGRAPSSRQVVSSLYDYASTVGVDAQMSILVDPLSVLMMLVVTGVSTADPPVLDRLHGRRPGLRALLRLPELLRLLDAAAGDGGQLRPAHRGWAFVGAASYLLISFWYRRTTATSAGIKAFVINVIGDIGLVLGTFFLFRHTGTVDFLRTFERRRATFFAQGRRRPHRGLPAAARRRVRQVRADPAAHLAAGRDGGPDAGLGADPRRDDGHRRRLPHRAHAPAVRAGARRRRRRARSSARSTLLVAGTIGLVVTDLKRVIAYSTMSQIGYMIMGVSGGAYVAGMFHLMTHAFFKALLFMAAGSIIGAMARRAVPRPHGRLPQGDAVHLRLLRHRRPGAVGHPAVLGLLLQGRDPARPRRAGRLALGALRRRLRRRVPDRDLHVAHDLPRLLRRAGRPRRASSSRATCTTPRSTPTRRRARRRTPTSASPARSTTSPSARSPMRVAMGAARRARSVFGGIVLIPKHDDLARHVPGADVRRLERRTSSPDDGLLVLGLVLGAVVGLAGIALAYRDLGAAARHAPRGCASASRPLHALLRQQVVLRRARSTRSSSGRSRGSAASASRRSSASSSTGRSSAGRPASSAPGSAAVRAAQSGFLRSYAALLLFGAGRRRPLLPAAARDPAPVDPALAPGRRRACRPACSGGRAARRDARRSAGRGADARLRDRCSSPTSTGRARACSTSPTSMWISELGIHYKLGVDGLNLFLIAADDACCSPPSVALVAAAASGRASAVFCFHLGARARPRCSAR